MDSNRAIPDRSFREFEHDGWQMVSGGYHDHFAGLTGQTIGPMLDRLRVGPATVVLDVACGPGYVAAEAARRGASVVGVDFSAIMLEAAARLYPDIEFLEGDAEALPFQEMSFDAVSMNFGLLHLERPEAALAECHRVLKPGGRFAFSVWGPPAESLAFGIVLDAIGQHGDAAIPLPAGPPFFRFSDLTESELALTNHGFSEIAFDRVPMIWRLGEPEELYRAFLTGTPRTGGLLRAQSESDLTKIEAAVTAAARRYYADGATRIPMVAVVASASRA